MSESKSLSTMQKEVDQFIGNFEIGYFPPLEIVLRMAEEVGEIAREINHQFGSKIKKPDEKAGRIGEELADLLFVIITMANSLEIDLEQEFEGIMKKYKTRDAYRWSYREKMEGREEL